MKYRSTTTIVFLTFLGVMLPSFAFAATPKVAVWVPYWRKASGTPELHANLSQVHEISPFSYEVEEDGTIKDTMKLAAEPWVALAASSSAKKIALMPSILWIDGGAMHRTLSSTSSRKAHVLDILAMVERNKFSGIDIDYEGKRSETRYYFSQFLKELSQGLTKQKKLLSCTIEARTPPSSLYKIIPKNIERANDYVAINKYCDTVRLMTYDQTTADLKLNKSKGDGVFYAPVADTEWVKKVIGETTKTIAKKKIMLGVATYGYEYRVDLTDRTDPQYEKLRAVTNKTALELASTTKSKVFTNISGEKAFAYTKNGETRFVTWSDAKSVQAKVKLAKQYGLRGVALFKVDGEGDPAIWNVLQ